MNDPDSTVGGTAVAPPPETRPPKVRSRPASAMLEPSILRRALVEAFVKLDPRHMIHTPVMFVVEIGSIITTVYFIAHPGAFVGWITVWLWATVLFANFAEAVAEGRGKAQADTLRRSRQQTAAFVRRADGTVDQIPSAQLRVGDLSVVTAGQVIPGDGDVVEGMATVDESAITGESAPVIRESGGDRSAVTGGTVVLSDRIVVRTTSNPGETFLDRMIVLVEGASRQKTPNEVALDILIAGLTLILLVAVVTLQPMAIYSKAIQSTVVLVALFVCLAPTTIGGLLSAIGIAGMDRMVQRNVLAMSGRAVEAAGDCSTLLLDKTGTITYGNRRAAEFIPAGGATESELAEAVLASSLADETPEGRSIVELAEARYELARPDLAGADLVPFTAQTRMSGIDLAGRRLRKGAADSVRRWVEDLGGAVPVDLAPIVERISGSGGTPLVVADGPRVLGVIHLKDTVKQGMVARFRGLRDMGIRTVMITGDNPLDEHRHAGRQGGRQHGRPRLEPDQADRGRRGRQAAAHHPRIAHDLLHRQRRRQVLCDHPGDVPGGVSEAQGAERHAPGQPAYRDPVRGDLQRDHHPAAHPPRPARREVPAPRRRRHPAAQRPHLRRWRDHRAVRIHQAHRSRRDSDRTALTCDAT